MRLHTSHDSSNDEYDTTRICQRMQLRNVLEQLVESAT
jgi:hypothetical protein